MAYNREDDDRHDEEDGEEEIGENVRLTLHNSFLAAKYFTGLQVSEGCGPLRHRSQRVHAESPLR